MSRPGASPTGRYQVRVVDYGSYRTGAAEEFGANALLFETQDYARDYAVDLAQRWLGLRAWRIMDLETGEVLEARDYKEND